MTSTSSRTPRDAAAAARRHDALRRGLTVFSVPLFLCLWEAVSRSGVVNIVLFPPPSTVAVALVDWIQSGEFFDDFWMSLSRVVIGFILGALAGSIVGVLTGRYELLAALLSPVFQLLRPIPPIAFVPIVILWFGLGETGKYFLVFWGVFFTVWIAAHIGVQKVDPGVIRAAKSLGTPERRMLREVLIPGALPYIVVGLRTSISVSFYTLVAAELAGTFAGLAYRIDIAQQNLQMGKMLAGLVVLGAISAAADRLFEFAARRLVWW
ncbi:MAG: ABC transporter permease [Pseudomonadota bacterium]